MHDRTRLIEELAHTRRSPPDTPLSAVLSLSSILRYSENSRRKATRTRSHPRHPFVDAHPFLISVPLPDLARGKRRERPRSWQADPSAAGGFTGSPWLGCSSSRPLSLASRTKRPSKGEAVEDPAATPRGPGGWGPRAPAIPAGAARIADAAARTSPRFLSEADDPPPAQSGSRCSASSGGDDVVVPMLSHRLCT